MSSKKCSHCGLVNFSTDLECRRCGAYLRSRSAPFADEDNESGVKKRGVKKRLLWIGAATLTALVVFYVSLLVSSDGISLEQKQVVYRAIDLLEQKGFTRDALMMRHFVHFRSTDNWWNRYMGHHEAYAATNFPFEIITLYPEFFDVPADDNERAVILLHESYHLFGHGEAATLEGVWRNKSKLDWTAEKYEQTKVWKNTKELTMSMVPELFRCGTDGQSDCAP